MNHLTHLDSLARASRRALRPLVALSLFLLPAEAVAAEGESTVAAEGESTVAAEGESGWSINFTPTLLFPSGDYRFGGGADPELKYTLDLGGARLRAGGRVGAYYAKNLFGVTAMPTLGLMVPVGPVEPYVAFGMGYGYLPKLHQTDFATMSRLGVVFQVSESLAIALEGTVQRIDNSAFRFPSFGSMISFDL